MLSDLTARAATSSVYAGRMGKVGSFEELQALPLTSYEHIHERMEKDGQARCLLAPPVTSFRTSGSTGTPKEFFYGQDDIQRILADYRLFSHIIGVKSDMLFWNLAGAPPDVSGYVLEGLSKDLGLEGTTSLLRDDRDLVRALKQASRMERIDVVASGALVIYLVGRMSREPGFLPDLITDKAARLYHLPRPLARLAARVYLRGVDAAAMRAFADNVSVGISFAESLDTYRAELERCYPRLKLFDIYGSTENPIMAAQMVQGSKGLSLLVGAIVPELIPSEDLRVSAIDPDHPPPDGPLVRVEGRHEGRAGGLPPGTVPAPGTLPHR